MGHFYRFKTITPCGKLWLAATQAPLRGLRRNSRVTPAWSFFDIFLSCAASSAVPPLRVHSSFGLFFLHDYYGDLRYWRPLSPATRSRSRPLCLQLWADVLGYADPVLTPMTCRNPLTGGGGGSVKIKNQKNIRHIHNENQIEIEKFREVAALNVFGIFSKI